MGDGVTQLCMDRRLYQRELSKSERAKQDKFLSTVISVVTAPAPLPSTTNGDTLEINQGNNESNPNINTKPTSTGSDMDRSVYLDTILEQLTPDDVRVLIRSEDELAQATHFSRIFPTQVIYIRK